MIYIVATFMGEKLDTSTFTSTHRSTQRSQSTVKNIDSVNLKLVDIILNRPIHSKGRNYEVSNQTIHRLQIRYWIPCQSNDRGQNRISYIEVVYLVCLEFF